MTIKNGDIVNGYTVTVYPDHYDLYCDNDGWVYGAKFTDYPTPKHVFDRWDLCGCDSHAEGKIMHCGSEVEWIDCPKHADVECFGTRCIVCDMRDFDCESLS